MECRGDGALCPPLCTTTQAAAVARSFGELSRGQDLGLDSHASPESMPRRGSSVRLLDVTPNAEVAAEPTRRASSDAVPARKAPLGGERRRMVPGGWSNAHALVPSAAKSGAEGPDACIPRHSGFRSNGLPQRFTPSGTPHSLFSLPRRRRRASAFADRRSAAKRPVELDRCAARAHAEGSGGVRRARPAFRADCVIFVPSSSGPRH